MKNPFLGNYRNTVYYLSVWAGITWAHILILSYHYQISFVPAVADGLIFNLIFAGLGLGIWYSVRYLHLDRRNLSSLLTHHLILLLVFMTVWISVSFFLVQLITEGDKVYLRFLKQSFPLRIATGILYYLTMIMIYYLYIYYMSFREKLVKEASLRTLVKETELSLLKSQINPHFIFNSLNSINSLTITNPPQAQEMIIKLSAFLRYALEQDSRHLITFGEELENSILYLDIEKTRFGERLVFTRETEPGTEDFQIPNLILQPIIENAVKHGVYESTHPVTIHLAAVRDRNFLRIEIRNDFDPEAVPKRGKGIGLKNVKERLFLIYRHRELVQVVKENNSFSVTLYIPQEDNT